MRVARVTCEWRNFDVPCRFVLLLEERDNEQNFWEGESGFSSSTGDIFIAVLLNRFFGLHCPMST
jgi:hypothetical protein